MTSLIKELLVLLPFLPLATVLAMTIRGSYLGE